MKTLHLNLKRKWFDMILSGEKKEEYREIKDYWTTKFVPFLFVLNFDNLSNSERLIKENYDKVVFFDDEWDTITFSNGYSKDRDQFIIEFNGFEIKKGKPEWGADPGKKYFILKLGKIISKNINKPPF